MPRNRAAKIRPPAHEAEIQQEGSASTSAPPAVKAKPEDAEPHPLLVLARKHLRRWDLAWECSGAQQWIESTGSTKKVWLILQIGDDVKFEPLD